MFWWPPLDVSSGGEYPPPGLDPCLGVSTHPCEYSPLPQKGPGTRYSPWKGYGTGDTHPPEKTWNRRYPPLERTWDQRYHPRGQNDWQTPLKTLPSATSVAGGKYECSYRYMQVMLLRHIVYCFVGDCTIRWRETMANLGSGLVSLDKLKPTIQQVSSVITIWHCGKKLN